MEWSPSFSFFYLRLNSWLFLLFLLFFLFWSPLPFFLCSSIIWDRRRRHKNLFNWSRRLNFNLYFFNFFSQIPFLLFLLFFLNLNFLFGGFRFFLFDLLFLFSFSHCQFRSNSPFWFVPSRGKLLFFCHSLQFLIYVIALFGISYSRLFLFLG